MRADVEVVGPLLFFDTGIRPKPKWTIPGIHGID